MKFKIVAIYDRVAEVFGQPSVAPSLGGFIRSFADEVNRNDANNQLFLHPDDFELFEIGEYDDSNAEIVCLERPRLLSRGADVATATRNAAIVAGNKGAH